MSGKLLAISVVSLCIALAIIALCLRSRDTAHVREFWEPRFANLIQHARLVERERPSKWQDISDAPGLVHLRATLVEDRYYRWPSHKASETELKDNKPSVQRLRFSSNVLQVEISIDIESGTVININTNRAAQLIPSSRQAIARYLTESLHPHPE